MGILWIANKTQAMPASPVNNTTFANVFALSPIAVLASMLAYLFAQYIDISIYHFWKRVTKGKHLWLRNNFSTFSSQFIDTFTVVSLLCIFKVLPWNLFYGLVVSGFLFKVMIAMLDTPLLYAVVFILRKSLVLNLVKKLFYNIELAPLTKIQRGNPLISFEITVLLIL